MSFTVIIPARLASTRLPNKPIADICGKPMIVRVAEQALKSGASRVICAVDDELILKACEANGIEACLTRKDHACGTDRLCAAGICNRVLIPGEKEVYGFQLAIDPSQLSVGELRRELYNLGTSDFISDFNRNFPKVNEVFTRLDKALSDVADTVPLSSLIDDIPTLKKDIQ